MSRPHRMGPHASMRGCSGQIWTGGTALKAAPTVGSGLFLCTRSNSSSTRHDGHDHGHSHSQGTVRDPSAELDREMIAY